MVHYVLCAADGCHNGGGFGGAEVVQGRFREHIGCAVQIRVVDGLPHGGGGDNPAVLASLNQRSFPIIPTLEQMIVILDMLLGNSNRKNTSSLILFKSKIPVW